MKKSNIFLLLIIFSVIFTFQQKSHAQEIITPSVISGGGTSSSNSTYSINGTLGQPVIDNTSGTAYNINAGFWNQISFVELLPDLIGQSIAFETSGTKYKGSSYTINYSIENQGTASTSGSFNVQFYLSADTEITTSDNYLGETTVTDPVIVGSTTGTLSANVTIPGTILDGDYYLGMIIDTDDSIKEIIETNNTLASAISYTICTDVGRNALIELYKSTNGDNWTNKAGWKEPPLYTDGFAMPGTECSWYGVTCDASGNVIKLKLSNNKLVGTIPNSIGDLTNLQHLHLDHNYFLTGPIPVEIGNLVKLSNLNLVQCRLTGSIPASLENLKKLWVLNLGVNTLSGSIPPELGNLANLHQLYLNNNRLTGSIPASLGNLKGLGLLHVQNNKLSGSIPPEIGSLPILQALRMENNYLSGSIPPEMGSLPAIQGIRLENNRLSGPIPPELGNLPRLGGLWIQGNMLSGEIPTTFLGLTTLGGIDFRWNALYTSNDDLRAFLNSKQTGGDWESTQTIEPTNLAAGIPITTSVPLNWTAITYTGNTGGYEVYYSTTSGVPYTLFETTETKSVESTTVTGLTPSTNYFFSLRTVTKPHSYNKNTVYSEYSDEVSAATATENNPPVLDPIGDQSVDEGDTLTFTVTASDPDNDTLTFNSPNLPQGATLDTTTGEFKWIPDYDDAGTYLVTFTVSDCSLTDSKDITITVEDEPYGAAQVIDENGGTISNTGEIDVDGDGIADPTIEIDIPADALPPGETAEITIEPHSEYILGEEYGEIIGPQYDFGPEGTTFTQPIEVRFYFGHIDPVDYGYDPDMLTIFYYDETIQDWIDIREPPHNIQIYYDHAYDDPQPYIYFYTDHFSTYALVKMLNQPPIADAGLDQTVFVNDTVTFDCSGSSDPDGEIVSFEWDFGDGSTDCGSDVFHIYATADTYTVTLTVTDDYGAQVTDKALITVQTPEQAINGIITEIGEIELSNGIAKSFISKLENAVSSVERENIEAIIGKLNAFIYQVEALIGKKLTSEEGQILIDAANTLIEYLSGHLTKEANKRQAGIADLPKSYLLEHNYPNPFNPKTTIRFHLPNSSFVTFKIYNVNGTLVKTLVSESISAGVHSFVWNGTNESGQQVSSGMYIYRLQAGKFSAVKKMLFIK